MNEQQRQIERQVHEAKQRLNVLCADRRAVNLESLSLRRDRGHFTEELAFLQKTVEDEEQTLGVIRGTNNFLEKSYHDLNAYSVVIEQQWRDILQQLSQEKELVRSAERQNAEMK